MSSSKNFELKKTDFLSKSNSTFIDEMHMKFVNMRASEKRGNGDQPLWRKN